MAIKDLLLFPLSAACGILFAYFGVKLCCTVVFSLFSKSFEFITTTDVNYFFKANFLILFGWFGLFVAVWAGRKNVYNMLSLSILPISYVLIKGVYVSVIPVITTLNPFSLSGWTDMMKDKHLLLIVTETFAIGDLSVGSLILLHFFFKARRSLSRVGISIILLICFMVCPLGLTIYLLWESLPTIWFWLFSVTLFTLASVTELREPTSMWNEIGFVGLGWTGLLLWMASPKIFHKFVKEIFLVSISMPAFNYVHVLLKYQVINYNQN
jgi:hypothetical protein